MKIDCEVIRDILPLYADDACSEKSRQMVDEHLEECSACREQLERIRKTEMRRPGLKPEKILPAL